MHSWTLSSTKSASIDLSSPSSLGKSVIVRKALMYCIENYCVWWSSWALSCALLGSSATDTAPLWSCQDMRRFEPICSFYRRTYEQKQDFQLCFWSRWLARRRHQFSLQHMGQDWDLASGSDFYFHHLFGVWDALKPSSRDRASRLGRVHITRDGGHTHGWGRTNGAYKSVTFMPPNICLAILENKLATFPDVRSGANHIPKRLGKSPWPEISYV